MAARPMAPPSCCAVWSRPDTVPAWARSTPPRTTTVTGIRARRRDAAQPHEARREPERADEQHRARADLGDETRADAGRREDRQAEREERGTGRHGAEAEDELEILRHEEERRELCADDERHQHERSPTGPVADERERQERRRDAALGAHEEG